ncbi:hypothetical protein [Methanonatronarchaeum sp. AMET6-2]|nr:hypothetical protein [Methanonatronarchaeum sp. AMET6-2]
MTALEFNWEEADLLAIMTMDLEVFPLVRPKKPLGQKYLNQF